MTAQTEVGKTREVTVVENILAPEVYADDAPFFLQKSGNIVISFESARIDVTGGGAPPYPIRRVIVGRLVMPAAGAQGLAIGLYDFLVGQGLEPKRDDKRQN